MPESKTLYRILTIGFVSVLGQKYSRGLSVTAEDLGGEEVAAQLCADRIVERYQEDAPPDVVLPTSLHEAHRAILDLREQMKSLSAEVDALRAKPKLEAKDKVDAKPKPEAKG